MGVGGEAKVKVCAAVGKVNGGRLGTLRHGQAKAGARQSQRPDLVLGVQQKGQKGVGSGVRWGKVACAGANKNKCLN